MKKIIFSSILYLFSFSLWANDVVTVNCSDSKNGAVDLIIEMYSNGPSLFKIEDREINQFTVSYDDNTMGITDFPAENKKVKYRLPMKAINNAEKYTKKRFKVKVETTEEAKETIVSNKYCYFR